MATQSNDYELKDLLKNVGEGKIQLPEFQREWVWDDSKICKLIESITMGFPMGALMFLESGGVVNYQPRLFTGVDPSKKNIMPDFLVLDGQQRLTTLYQVFMNESPVETCMETNKNKPVKRYYYIDIKMALEAKKEDSAIDIEDAIISISEKKTKIRDMESRDTLDLSTVEDEYKNMMFPLNLMFSDKCFDWLDDMEEFHGKQNKDTSDNFRKIKRGFRSYFIEPMRTYKLPVIKVLKETNLSSVCQIFENVNRGGVELNVFDLVTASLAADNVSLRKEWEEIKNVFDKQPCKLLSKIDGTDFLTSMTLWESYEQYCKKESAVKCKKKDVLNLNSTVFKLRKEGMKYGFISANKFLVKQCIYSPENLPYTTQFIPLAAIFAYDKNHKNLLIHQDNLDRLARWYWCGVFGELYGSANESRYALDIKDFFEWIGNNNENMIPDTVARSIFQATRILTLRRRTSAACKGLMALMLQDKPLDFASAQEMSIATYIDENTDIHHIFPAKYCHSMGYKDDIYDSIVNKTMIYATTNRSIGGYAPSEYIQKLFMANKANPDAIKNAIRSHNIDFDLLNADKFNDFIVDRANRLLKRIERATGKPIAGRDSKETFSAFGDISLQGKD